MLDELHHSLAIQFLANCHLAMEDLVEWSMLELFKEVVGVEEESEGSGTLMSPIMIAD